MAKNTDKVKANTAVADVRVGDTVTVVAWVQKDARKGDTPKRQAQVTGEVLELRPSSKNRTIVVLRQAHGSTTRYTPEGAKVFRAKS